MRLGAWDCLDKKATKGGSTYDQLLLSILQGLQEQERALELREFRSKAGAWVLGHLAELSEKYPDQYVSVEKVEDDFAATHSAKTLLGLYTALGWSDKDLSKANIHVTVIPSRGGQAR